MAVYQLDTEKQAYDVYSFGHNYAWTNTYLIESPNDLSAQKLLEQLIDIEIATLPEDTNIRFACWRHGIGGPIPAGVQFIGLNGLLPSTGVYMPWANTARILGYSGRKLVWFKRWRGPLRDVDMSGELLSGSYYAALGNDYVYPLRTSLPLVTRSGELLTHWVVDPYVRMWQRRDGTTRNVRSVLAG